MSAAMMSPANTGTDTTQGTPFGTGQSNPMQTNMQNYAGALFNDGSGALQPMQQAAIQNMVNNPVPNLQALGNMQSGVYQPGASPLPNQVMTGFGPLNTQGMQPAQQQLPNQVMTKFGMANIQDGQLRVEGRDASAGTGIVPMNSFYGLLPDRQPPVMQPPAQRGVGQRFTGGLRKAPSNYRPPRGF